MDYEWHIQLAEKELAHFRDMQNLVQSHLNAHDDSIKASIERFTRIEQNLENVTEGLATLTQKVDSIAQKMANLVDIIAKKHSNGQG